MPDREGHRFLSSYRPGSDDYQKGLRLVQRQIRERDTLGPLFDIAELTMEEYIDLAKKHGADAVKNAIREYGREFRIALGPDVEMVE
ncbi:hypothetical protein HY087_02960 [Candidatus Gottesmanbacteria bacterium]|nr:hypothetical protein [Candidatus Gottesmanbacteria bacterium]MBI3560061.1 hypothetical protein [Candidatus Gottesmanbacteria bacterium]